MDVSALALLKTYTLYLRDGETGPAAFEPVMCMDDSEVVAKALQVLESNPHYHAVDVFFGDTELFRVKQPLRKGPTSDAG